MAQSSAALGTSTRDQDAGHQFGIADPGDRRSIDLPGDGRASLPDLPGVLRHFLEQDDLLLGKAGLDLQVDVMLRLSKRPGHAICLICVRRFPGVSGLQLDVRGVIDGAVGQHHGQIAGFDRSVKVDDVPADDVGVIIELNGEPLPAFLGDGFHPLVVHPADTLSRRWSFP